MKKPQQRITFRIPKPLLRWFKEQAKEEECSMNTKLIEVLKEAKTRFEQAKEAQAEKQINT